MSPSDDERALLARRQGELVAALVGGGGAPTGFDAGDLAVATRSIALKRLRELRRAWPTLCRRLEPGLEGRFVAYAIRRPPPAGNAMADGMAFAHFLRRRGDLPEAARLELLAFRARWRLRGGHITPRRRAVVVLATLRGPPRLAVLLCAPRLGRRLLQLPLPWGQGWRTRLGKP